MNYIILFIFFVNGFSGPVPKLAEPLRLDWNVYYDSIRPLSKLISGTEIVVYPKKSKTDLIYSAFKGVATQSTERELESVYRQLKEAEEKNTFSNNREEELLLWKLRTSLASSPHGDKETEELKYARGLVSFIGQGSHLVNRNTQTKRIRRLIGVPMRFGLKLELNPNPSFTEIRVKGLEWNGPKERYDFQPGDVITKVNKESSLLSRIYGLDETKEELELEWYRPSFPMKKRITKFPFSEFYYPEVLGGHRRDDKGKWVYQLDENTAFIRIREFNIHTPLHLISLVRGLSDKGINELILDLRYTQSIGITNEMVWSVISAKMLEPNFSAKWYVVPKGREFLDHHFEDSFRYANLYSDAAEAFRIRGSFTTRGKIALLVGPKTSYSAELFAGLLKDKAVLMGARTAGKGMILDNFNRDATPDLLLPVSEIVLPGNKTIQKKPDHGPLDAWGLKPEAEYFFPEDPSIETDWEELSIREVGSTKALKLDDLGKDSLLEFARRKLKEIAKKKK